VPDEEEAHPVTHEPQLQERAAQPYAGIRTSVTMDGLSAAVDEAFPELFGWLGGRGIEVAGPPFIRYHVIDMQRDLEIELGVPADMTDVDGGRIRPGVLPGGRYVVLRHVGPYDGLVAGNAALLDWAREHAVALDSWDTSRGTAWRSRVEHYLTNPATEPDPAKWEVDIAYLTAGT
jgi:effector-binding domain-containing protein